MLRTKTVSVILALTVVTGVFAGCKAGGTGKLVDGTYKVEFEKFDTHGYKPQLELTVSGGKITEVKYDEAAEDGKFKSQDESYKKKMEEGSSTYPEKAFKELQERVVTKQSANIDAVSGATASSTTFKTLAKYALEKMANEGKTTTAKIPASK